MHNFYNFSLYLIFGFSAIVYVLLFFISAPYGKFQRRGWGLTLPAKWAWMVMEFISPALITWFFITSDNKNIPQIIFVSVWLLHYVYRTFVYPFTQSGRDKPYPLIIAMMAIIFNGFNGFINGYGVFHLYSYDSSWLWSWQFITGVILFLTGFVINKTADEKFRTLRTLNPREYKIPEGWLFKYISSPHYFGEIIEWGGWAVMTWSLPGLAFFIFTFANLFPRGITSRKWYKSHFPDYPPERKAIIPFVI